MAVQIVSILSVVILAAGIGWILFSLAAGTVLYLSLLTTDHAAFEPKKLAAAEGSSAITAHTKDPVIMTPLSAAKDRWYALRDTHSFDELVILSRDGLRLSAFFWKADGANAERTVLIVHGMLDSAAGMGYLAEEYHRRNWNVLCIDQRAHGESEGVTRTMGVREAEDIALWVSELENRYRANYIVVHGVSMGGSAALQYGEMSRASSSSVRGIISDAGYAAYSKIFLTLLMKAIPVSVVAMSLLWGASVASFVHSGVSFGRMNPAKHIDRIHVPLLLFHGQKDVLVPVSFVRSMFDLAARRGAEIIVVPDAPHLGAYFYAPDFYMDKISKAFGKESI